MSGRAQVAIGLGTTLVGLGLMAGAATIPSEVGYTGIGSNFLPWGVGIGLALAGALLTKESLTGGFRRREAPSGSDRAHWRGFAWVSAGLLLNAGLITHIGFVLSCALCFAMAVHGLRGAAGDAPGGLRPWAGSLAIGAAIAAPVFWMFTQLLSIQLPSLTSTGWL